ncbi:enoyl- delta isomerase 2, mitochondrial isoform X2 [Pelobates cultripes]|uniref:Enoyl- delta isomerase 2, mitochondrial isoform X2 n=1 Tax=Pelobates cultripes TaxID=61616 RepID=A0AAD1RYT4_PELCU|nr:enoyl- delta isomerase 2, mitochondrial isoform X2 [Pelobates cultripes]
MKREVNIVPNAVSSEAMKQKYTQPMKQNYETLLVSTQDCITTITMNRPEKKNAMSPQMCFELSAALEDAANDDSVFTVITGAGDYFSSGSDLTSALKSKEQLDAPPVNSENPFRHIVKKIIDFQKPLIAVVNGPAIGIGVTVLALFDTVYATERATFNTPFTKLALHPEACSSYTFPRIMGPSKAIEILMFNRKFTAREACDIGLVAEVFPDNSFHREVRTKLKEYAKLPKNMCFELSAALEDAANDDSVFTVITGAGDYFSSGSDLTSALKSKEQLDAPPVNSENPFRHIVKKIIDFQKPLIAVVNGPAIGIGVTVLALFDTVYATERATFNTPFTKLALHPEACSSYTFPRIMGPSKAIEILMFNKKFTAREACDIGLVAEVFPDNSFHREVRTKLKEYAKLPKNCLTASKLLIRDMEKEKLHEVCDKEFELIQKRANSKESLEAIKNFFQKKAKLAHCCSSEVPVT